MVSDMKTFIAALTLALVTQIAASSGAMAMISKCIKQENFGNTCATYEQDKTGRYTIKTLTHDGEETAWIFQKNIPNEICKGLGLGKAFLVFGEEDQKVNGTEENLFWYEGSTPEARKQGLHRPILQYQCLASATRIHHKR